MKTNQAFFTKIANLYINTFKYVKVSKEYIDNFQHAEMNFLGKLYLEYLTREWTEEGKIQRRKIPKRRIRNPSK